MFTGVFCHSVHSGEGCYWQRPLPPSGRQVSILNDRDRDPSDRDPPDRDPSLYGKEVKSGKYESYWNAFLLPKKFYNIFGVGNGYKKNKDIISYCTEERDTTYLIRKKLAKCCHRAESGGGGGDGGYFSQSHTKGTYYHTLSVKIE